jgi:hypothetical protein
VEAEVIIGSHIDCMAQQIHLDTFARKVQANHTQVAQEHASVIVALWATILLLYPLSHKRIPKDKNKKFILTEVHMPSGSFLFFTAIAHAGYGIWDLGGAFIHPCPSEDDLFAVPLQEFLIRYQAHLGRPQKAKTNLFNPYSTVRLNNTADCASYLHVDHSQRLLRLYAPVFATIELGKNRPLSYDHQIEQAGAQVEELKAERVREQLEEGDDADLREDMSEGQQWDSDVELLDDPKRSSSSSSQLVIKLVIKLVIFLYGKREGRR